MMTKSIKSFSAALMVALFLVTAMPVMAEELPATPTPTPTPTVAPTPNQKLIDGLACMQKAVGVREDAVAAAWNTGSASIVTALSNRKSALNTAWGEQNRKLRNAALIKAWKDFGVSARAAKKTFNSSRYSAWKQFNTERAACKKAYGAANTTSLDYGTMGSDLAL